MRCRTAVARQAHPAQTTPEGVSSHDGLDALNPTQKRSYNACRRRGTSAIHRTACTACRQNAQGIASSSNESRFGPVWAAMPLFWVGGKPCRCPYAVRLALAAQPYPTRSNENSARQAMTVSTCRGQRPFHHQDTGSARSACAAGFERDARPHRGIEETHHKRRSQRRRRAVRVRTTSMRQTTARVNARVDVQSAAASATDRLSGGQPAIRRTSSMSTRRIALRSSVAHTTYVRAEDDGGAGLRHQRMQCHAVDGGEHVVDAARTQAQPIKRTHPK